MEGKLLLMFMDVLVLSALAGTIYYLRNISSSIKVIREGKTELQQILQQLNVHISNASHAVEDLKKQADSKGTIIQKHIDEANSVIDEMQFIQRAAENVAQRLERLTGQAAAPYREEDTTPPAKAAARAPLQKTMSKAEKELAEAMAKKAAGE